MNLTRIDEAFKSDDIDFVKLQFKLMLMEFAWDKLVDAAYTHADTEGNIGDGDIVANVQEAYRIYDFFAYPDESIREFIQEAWNEYFEISDEDLDKLWEEL
jgi:hypothetical protein